MTFQGGAAWRQAVLADLGRSRKVRAIIDPLSDDELGALMTNLGGHDIETIIAALRAAEAAGDQPTCFIAYTIKGMGLPFAGHKDNHAGLMTKEQMDVFRTVMDIRPGHEWDRFEGLGASADELQAFLDACPFSEKLTPEGRALHAPLVAVPTSFPTPRLTGRKTLHTVGVRRNSGGDRTRPGRVQRPGGSYSHHQPGCDGFHQSRAVGEPAGVCSIGIPATTCSATPSWPLPSVGA